ncbi:Phenylalanine--tRNA ligase beta subunit [Serratia fonticola]|uniref:Phenylalanine--tRNA ligase beta subunit n=1 Tax=Serratia fonticola TaxID=47917 RepID=A0A4U9T876_SERFO|nr:Phenylalanine--tRNA ligase beta subunit [Serratia fonticola]
MLHACSSTSAGGQAGPIIDVSDESTLPKRATIALRREKLDRLIGHVVPSEQVSDILRRLGCQVTEQGDNWLAVAPSWRFDMEIEEDLVEEVARVYGYNNIPDVPVRADLVMTKHRESDLTLKRVKTMLVDHGYQEAITYSFVDPKVQALLHPGEEALILPSPISVEMSAMRLSLWTGLLSAVVYNQNRQQTRVRLFESGLRFVPDTAANLGIRQDVMLAGVIAGHTHDEHWDLARKPVDFYDLKGDLESVLELTGKLSEIQFKAESNPPCILGKVRPFIYTASVSVSSVWFTQNLNVNWILTAVLWYLNWSGTSSQAAPCLRPVRFLASLQTVAISPL